MDFTMIYLNISLFHWTVGSSKADSLSGSPSIFISWHRAWHMMDQSSRSRYSLLSPTPPVLSLVSCEYALISISTYLHLSRSMVYFTFINPGVTFSIFILIPLSAPIKLPLLPDKILTWLLDHHSLSSPLSHWLLLLSLLWWPFCVSLSSKCQSVPGFLFLICTYSVNLTALNITHMMKTSELYISSLQNGQSYSLQQDIAAASSRHIRTNRVPSYERGASLFALVCLGQASPLFISDRIWGVWYKTSLESQTPIMSSAYLWLLGLDCPPLILGGHEVAKYGE